MANPWLTKDKKADFILTRNLPVTVKFRNYYNCNVNVTLNKLYVPPYKLLDATI